MTNDQKELLEKCLSYFLKYGIREMSNDKLAKALGISTKTLYKYFINKEQLLEQAAQLFHKQQYEMLNSLPVAPNAAIQFYEIWEQGVAIEYDVNKAFFKDLSYYYPEVADRIEKSISKKFIRKFQELLERGILKGDLRNDIIPEVIMESIFVQYTALVRTERFKKFKLSSRQAFHHTIAVIIRGLCTSKSLQAFDSYISKKQK